MKKVINFLKSVWNIIKNIFTNEIKVDYNNSSKKNITKNNYNIKKNKNSTVTINNNFGDKNGR